MSGTNTTTIETLKEEPKMGKRKNAANQSAQSHKRQLRFGPMMRKLLLPSRSRRWITPIVMLFLLLGIIAGAFIVSSVTQQHVQLDDGTVWITSLKDRKAARFNAKNKDVDAGVSSAASRFDVAQHNGSTVISEGTKASNIAASTISETGNTAIKTDIETIVGGDTAAFINVKTGNVWVGSASDVKSVNPTTDKPKMKLGSGGKITVTHNGTVYGYRASDGAVMSIDKSQGACEQVGTIGGAPHAESFTVIGETPVVAAKGTVYWPQGSAAINLQGSMTLQAPSTDGKQNGWVAVATPRGLATVNLSTKKASETPNSGKGEPAQPVSTGGCVFSAWEQKANNYAKVCSTDGSDMAFDTLTNINATSELIFRTNHRLVILNDVVNGNVWNPQESTKVIKIQWNKVETKQSKQQEQNNDSANNQHNFSKTCSSQSGQIKAEDDSFGARTGSQQILDVLRNDEQTDCSVLRITLVSAPDGANISVSPVYDGRYLQLDASAAAEGSASFSYEISDGRGQTSNAKVNLTLVGGDDNAPQQTDTPPEIDVEQGTTYATNALGSFSDPDGDPLTLVSATPQNTDQVTVSTRADGQLVFNAGSMPSGRAGIEVTVSDGQQTGTGMVYFSVKPANTLAAVIDPVVKQTTPDTRTTVSLKQYVHGTSAEPAQLTAVETPSGASTTMNAADMSFTFSAPNPGTYYVPYTITQGSIPATGLARIEVQTVAGDFAKPIAANDVALLGADNTAIVEPLANDVDPMGGVLSVTNVTADMASGIKTGVVSNKRVYITARQVPTEPVQIKYGVANAAGTSTGVIVLQPPALATSNSVPKADNITTQVRTDGIVSINVLDHVTYADGTTVSLQNDLQYDKNTFKGLVFVSGNTVRYQASDQTGSFPVTYTVKDNLGNAASATITINVHQKDAENKAAPTPSDVEAQVAAGQKVQIPITLTGIDSDGNDVQLLGLGNKAPTLGRISEVGATYLVYEAYADSAGTDTFSYAVEDWTGQRSQAQIRVGVFKSGTDSGVYARDDEITLRPNTAATIPVAQNDISGDSTDLTVSEDIESQDISNVTVADNMLAFTTPQQVGTYYVAYAVKDKAGLSDTATLTVNVDGNATIEPPTAYDYRVPSSATIDKKSVDVDVSQWIANPSGSADELHVAVDDSATDHAHVRGGDKSTTITVELTDEARAVPYTVTNTTYDITSTAFIQVPAYGVFPPILRPKAPALKVNARETITINIADYVRVGAGKTAYVDGADSVSATKAADGDLYVNDQMLKFTAPKDYSGPASITFTAVDGKRDKNDKVKIINSAVLTLPITVIGRDVPAPTFSSSTIDVVAGESATTIDLTALTHSASDLYDDEKRYTYSGGADSDQVSAKVSSNGKLTVSADKTTSPGTTVSVPISIQYSKGTVSAGVTVRVTASNRPLARINAKALKVKAGSSEEVNLLADAYNPFPDSALTVTGCTSDGASKLTVDCPANGVVSISAASDIGASTNKVIVNVRDATNTKEREVTGIISISVMDKPDAPLLSPIAGDPQDGAVNLSWTAGSSNGSPISEYKMTWSGDGSGEKSCGSVTSCQITGLKNGKTYSFKVQAKNEIGWSKESNGVEGTPDKLPDAPTDVKAEAGKNTVVVTWKAPEGNFSAVDGYEVTLNGSNMANPTQKVEGTSFTFKFNDNAITNGASYTATVKAHNKMNWSQPSATSNAVSPWGTPDKPTISAVQNSDKIVVSGRINDARNSKYQSITVNIRNEDKSVETNATNYSVEFDIKNEWYYKEIKPTITVVTEHSGSLSSETSVSPFTAVDPPTNVKLELNNNICVATWSKKGRVTGFVVKAKDYYNDDVHENRAEWPLSGNWSTCDTVNVQQYFIDTSHISTPETASSNTVGNKTKAEITTMPTLAWDVNATNLIKVAGGSVKTWNQIGSYSFVFTGGGKTYEIPWTQGTSQLNAEKLPTGVDYTWKFKVTGPDPALNNEVDGSTIKDSDRYSEPTTDPETDPNPDQSESKQSNTPTASSVALSTIDGKSKPWVRGLAYYANR